MLNLNSIFSNHAVLPVETPITVWGATTPNAWVSGQIGDLTANIQAAADGSFELRFAPLKDYGPVVFSVSSGEDTIVLQDVQAGEVWLAAGQSNMGFSLARELPPVSPQELRRNDLRFFHVPETTRLGGVREAAAAWELPPECPEECSFTAVGFHFAEKVANEKKCPVGIIQATFGGASLASFLSRHTLTYEQVENAIDYFAQPVSDNPEKVADPIADYLKKHPIQWKDLPDKNDWQQIHYNDTDWLLQDLPDPWDMADVEFEYYGACRYRKALTIPESWKGADLELTLGMIDQQDTTWFNGTLVGSTGAGNQYDSFAVHRRYNIPAETVLPGQRNVIAVRPVSIVSMVLHGGILGPAEEMRLTNTATGETIALNGEWRCQFEQKSEPQVRTMTYQTLGAGIQHSFAMMHENLLLPIRPYPLTGILWYQGEADATEPEMATAYLDNLSLLIDQFRAEWNAPKLPFLIVQLPGFCSPKPFQTTGHWAAIRLAQLTIALSDLRQPAITADLCSDPTEIHFPNKRGVADRLARLWLYPTNKDTGEAPKGLGPFPIDWEIGSRQVTLYYHNVGEGLAWKDDVISTGFYLEGKNGVPEPATAKIIEPNIIRLECQAIKKPVKLYYCYSQNPGPFLTLVNSVGLPASPIILDLIGED